MPRPSPKLPEISIEEQRAITQAQLSKPGEAPGRPQDPLFEQRSATMHRRLAHTKMQPATLINCLPVPLAVNSCMPELSRRVPACTLKDKFTAYCWAKPIVEVIMSEGVRTPIDYVPRQMAEEFEREYTGENGPGGVMIFDGTIDEFLAAMEEEDAEVKAAFEECNERAVVWMTAKYTDANNSWNTPNHQLAGNITHIHRDSASRLKHMGRLPENVEPEWMDLKTQRQNATAPCPVCRTVPRPGAIICTTGSCNYVFDVAGAFQAKLIDENSLLLERLTRAQVEKLGVSAFVAETADEMEPRIRKGHAKPLSRVAQQQMADMAQAQAAQQSKAN
jgi:hypothetical protein